MMTVALRPTLLNSIVANGDTIKACEKVNYFCIIKLVPFLYTNQLKN